MTVGTPTFYPAGPIQIRDGTAARVKAMSGFANVYSQRVLPTKDTQMPFACVWHAGDRTEPWGDDNVGAPRFDHSLTMIVDVVIASTSQAALDAPIVDLVERLRATLLTDPTWVALFESCERCDATYEYPDGGFLYAHGVVQVRSDVPFRVEPGHPECLDRDSDLLPAGSERTHSRHRFRGQPVTTINVKPHPDLDVAAHKLIVHPVSGGLLDAAGKVPEAGRPWLYDGFTCRMLSDGAILRADDEAFAKMDEPLDQKTDVDPKPAPAALPTLAKAENPGMPTKAPVQTTATH